MPTFYNYTQDGKIYSFDDVFVPADVFREGNLWVWGFNSYGQLGINNTSNRTTPVTTFAGGANWKQVFCYSRSDFSSAIKTDGTLWNWGRNNRGQLGINNTTNRNTPVTTFAGGNNWKQVSSGYECVAAIKTDGTLWTWGVNTWAQLATNDGTDKRTPVTTFAGGSNWKQVSCGYRHVAAIKTDGTLWVWGNNSNGQLGINNTSNRNTPVTTFAGGNDWKFVSSSSTTAAIKTDGTLWVWGFGGDGRLGTNNTITRSTPVTTFAGGNNWKQVASGSNHIATIKTDGTLWVWGSNSGAYLGINNTITRSTPVTTFAGGTNWKQVSCGFDFTAATKTDGTLWVWGSNSGAYLGINNTITRSTPVTTFAGGSNWKQVTTGGSHTAAVTYIDPVI